MKAALAAVALAVLVAGCGTVPKTVIGGWSLEGEKIIFLEQSDRIPKDALIEAIKAGTAHSNRVMMAQMLSPEAIAEIVKQIATVAPEFSKVYANERMNEAMIGRRILIRGYGTNELEHVIEIIKALEPCFEKWSK